MGENEFIAIGGKNYYIDIAELDKFISVDNGDAKYDESVLEVYKIETVTGDLNEETEEYDGYQIESLVEKQITKIPNYKKYHPIKYEIVGSLIANLLQPAEEPKKGDVIELDELTIGQAIAFNTLKYNKILKNIKL